MNAVLDTNDQTATGMSSGLSASSGMSASLGMGPSSDAGTSRERRCIVTGDVLPIARLMRFVAGPDRDVVVDVEGKLPGRGLWVRAERGLIERAAARGMFSRAAKTSLVADAGLADRTEARLVERMLRQLGLARRSGELILGFDQVERALRGPDDDGRPAAVVVEATDAAPDGSRKLRGAALSRGLVPYVIAAFTSAELSLALGRANVVHAALKSGRMAERLILDSGRLAGFRPPKPWAWPGYSGA